LNLRYGRFYASPYSQLAPKRPPNVEGEQAGLAGESDLDVLWEAEALGVFQAAYNEAVGRFIDRSEETKPGDAATDESVVRALEEVLPQERAQGGTPPVSSAMLKSLPKGRVEWESPRNPWCPRRNVPQPSMKPSSLHCSVANTRSSLRAQDSSLRLLRARAPIRKRRHARARHPGRSCRQWFRSVHFRIAEQLQLSGAPLEVRDFSRAAYERRQLTSAVQVVFSCSSRCHSGAKHPI
jgi:hypothetical protein